MILQIEVVTTLPAFSLLVHVGVLWQVDDFDELRAGKLTGSPGCDVVGVARDPQGLQAVTACQGQQQPATPGRVSVSSVFWDDPVADVARVHHEVVRVSNSQVDAADFFMLTDERHPESVGRDVVDAGVTWILLNQHQFELFVD